MFLLNVQIKGVKSTRRPSDRPRGAGQDAVTEERRVPEDRDAEGSCQDQHRPPGSEHVLSCLFIERSNGITRSLFSKLSLRWSSGGPAASSRALAAERGQNSDVRQRGLAGWAGLGSGGSGLFTFMPDRKQTNTICKKPTRNWATFEVLPLVEFVVRWFGSTYFACKLHEYR